MEKVSIVIYPNVSKKNKKNQLIPLYLRIGVRKQKAEANIRIYLNEKEFTCWNPILMKLDSRENSINRQIAKLESKIEEIRTKHYPNFHKLSALEIKNEVFEINDKQKKNENISVIEYIDKFYKEKILPNGCFVYGTKKNYRKSINHLKKFLFYFNICDIKLVSFSKKNALDFKDYLLNDIEGINKLKLRQTSANGIVIKLKVIFKRAVEEEVLLKNPFSSISFNLEYKPKYRLSKDEIKRIAFVNLSNHQNLVIYRDVFLFSIFTGLSYSDTFNLKKDSITENNGEFLLTIHRAKTNEPVKQFLITHAIKIINKYKDEPGTTILNTIFPSRSLTKYNLYLKFLATLCSINHNLSNHVARHTCMQNLAEAEVDDIQVRNMIMGWSSKGLMSTNYYHVSENRLLNAKEKLEKYLKDSL